MVAATLGVNYPVRFFEGQIIAKLGQYDQPPQCAMSYLIVTTCVVEAISGGQAQSVAKNASPVHPLISRTGQRLSVLIATWLGAPDGLARTIAQYAMFAVTSARALDQNSATDQSSKKPFPYVEEQMQFLTDNRKCYKMREKQRKIFQSLDPRSECTLSKLLGHATGHDQEFLTGNLLQQIKDEMENVFAYFTEKDGLMACAHARALLRKAEQHSQLEALEANLGQAQNGEAQDEAAKLDVYIQRKVLPWKLHELIDVAERESTQRGVRRHQQDIIVCASLVDKVRQGQALAAHALLYCSHRLLFIC